MNYTNLTLGELLSSDNPAIKRNATGILKQLQKEKEKQHGRFIPFFDRRGKSKPHNCLWSAYCEICGLKI